MKNGIKNFRMTSQTLLACITLLGLATQARAACPELSGAWKCNSDRPSPLFGSAERGIKIENKVDQKNFAFKGLGEILVSQEGKTIKNEPMKGAPHHVMAFETTGSCADDTLSIELKILPPPEGGPKEDSKDKDRPRPPRHMGPPPKLNFTVKRVGNKIEVVETIQFGEEAKSNQFSCEANTEESKSVGSNERVSENQLKRVENREKIHHRQKHSNDATATVTE